MKTCYIFGAAEGMPDNFSKHKSDLVIAADAGFTLLKNLNVIPDIVLGDFDSLGYVPSAKEVIKHPVKKDDTDMILAVKTALERDYKNIVIYGGAGGRLDHLTANLQTLSFVSKKGGRALLCGDGFYATAITDSAISFSEAAFGNISVFSAETISRGVNIKGLLYELEDTNLAFDFPLGVSNEFVSKKSQISVEKGTLLIIWQGKKEWLY